MKVAAYVVPCVIALLEIRNRSSLATADSDAKWAKVAGDHCGRIDFSKGAAHKPLSCGFSSIRRSCHDR